MKESILDIKQLECHIDKQKIIQGVSAQVNVGDVIALLGNAEFNRGIPMIRRYAQRL